MGISLVSVHRKYSFIDYQNRICSFAALIAFVAFLVATFLPILWIYKVHNNNLLLSKDFIVYEQPRVKFQYRYVFTAEHTMESSDTVVCSSFQQLNRFEGTTNCGKVKVMEKDFNEDGVADEIQITFEFGTNFHYGAKSVSTAIFLDARINDQCQFRIPSAIVINQKHLLNNQNERQVVIRGVLQPFQSHSLVCPFFLRNVKSHFFFDNLNENQTDLEAFNIEKIQDNLDRNPMNLQFLETSTVLGEVDKSHTSVVIKVRIPQIPTRYRKTVWQKINEVWMNYVAAFAVTFFSINFVLNHLFESRWLIARKRVYLEKAD